MFLGSPVPSWQHHPLKVWVSLSSIQVGTREQFHPSLPLLLSTFPFQQQ